MAAFCYSRQVYVDCGPFSIRVSQHLGDVTELRYSRDRIRRASTAYSDPSVASAHMRTYHA